MAFLDKLDKLKKKKIKVISDIREASNGYIMDIEDTLHVYPDIQSLTRDIELFFAEGRREE